MRVFFDTSGLFAVLVRNDDMHARAKATFECLIERSEPRKSSKDAKILDRDRSVEFWTTSYVLLETVSLLQARVGLEAARRFNHEFSTILKIHWVTESLHERAFRRLELRGRREISLVDYASFVWMEETGISHVLAYDDHFSEEGFTVLGTPKEIERHLSPKPSKL